MINNNKVHFKKVSNQFFPSMTQQIPDILQLSKAKTKVIPNAEQAQIILNYFFYNNFQVFLLVLCRILILGSKLRGLRHNIFIRSLIIKCIHAK
jgi:hypothetical protein